MPLPDASGGLCSGRGGARAGNFRFFVSGALAAETCGVYVRGEDVPNAMVNRSMTTRPLGRTSYIGPITLTCAPRAGGGTLRQRGDALSNLHLLDGRSQTMSEFSEQSGSHDNGLFPRVANELRHGDEEGHDWVASCLLAISNSAVCMDVRRSR